MSQKDSKSDKKDSEPEYIMIERDNEVPLKFQGKLIGEADGHTTSGPTQNRWDNYYLYRTLEGEYILHHEYHTQWQGENGASEAWARDTLPLIVRIATYDSEMGEKIPQGLLECIKDAGLSDEIADIIE